MGKHLGMAKGFPEVPATAKYLDHHRRSRKPGGINLKAVSEVLTERGLDPTQALIDILQPVDAEGNDVPCRLPADIQARILNELLQYTQPKLKSIEIRGRIGVAAFDPTDEQAAALAAEFLASQALTKG